MAKTSAVIVGLSDLTGRVTHSTDFYVSSTMDDKEVVQFTQQKMEHRKPGMVIISITRDNRLIYHIPHDEMPEMLRDLGV